MALEVFMPKLTHDMEAGVLLEWYKQEGDEVQEGEPLYAVETDKAAVDVGAEATGMLHGLRFKPGDQVPVGEVLGWIVAPGEQIPPIGPPPKPAVAPAPRKTEESSGFPRAKASEASSSQAGGRIVASPVARRMAKQHFIDLTQIKGRGPHGRITEADVQAYIAQRSTTPGLTTSLGEVPYDVVSLSKLRRTTGARMLSSIRTIPHFDLEVEVDMAEAGRWRAGYAEEGRVRVSYTAFLVKAVAHALRRHPQLNSSFVDGELRVYRGINIGIATATADGLVVPVIHRADEMSVSQIQEAMIRLREKTQVKTGPRFAPDEIHGGTFTVSNLGMYGIDAFRAIINPPQAAILAVGRIAERPIGIEGQIVLRPVMRLVLSIDHRAVDGMQAASFLVALRRYLENPYLLL
jgi:pyruvate dehydrogenase E2 component (dihydrolipoamide acetyltransferase)